MPLVARAEPRVSALQAPATPIEEDLQWALTFPLVPPATFSGFCRA